MADFKNMTVATLREFARKLVGRGHSRLRTKRELIEALEAAQRRVSAAADKATSSLKEATGRLATAAHEATDRVTEATDEAAGKVRQVTGCVASATEEAAGRFREVTQRAVHAAEETAGRVREMAEKAARATEEVVEAVLGGKGRKGRARKGTPSKPDSAEKGADAAAPTGTPPVIPAAKAAPVPPAGEPSPQPASGSPPPAPPAAKVPPVIPAARRGPEDLPAAPALSRGDEPEQPRLTSGDTSQPPRLTAGAAPEKILLPPGEVSETPLLTAGSAVAPPVRTGAGAAAGSRGRTAGRRLVRKPPPPGVYDEALGELPEGYADDLLMVIPRDPQTLFLYWDHAAETLERARACIPGATPQVWLFERGADGVWRRARTLDFDLSSRSFYIHDLRPGHLYRAEIHLVSPEGEERLLPSRSNDMALPVYGPSPVVDDRYMKVLWSEPVQEVLREARASIPYADAFRTELRDQLASLSEGWSLPVNTTSTSGAGPGGRPLEAGAGGQAGARPFSPAGPWPRPESPEVHPTSPRQAWQASGSGRGRA